MLLLGELSAKVPTDVRIGDFEFVRFPEQFRLAADLSADGHLDLVLGSGELVFVEGSGDGKFGNPVSLRTPLVLRDLVPADFDEDGDVDLAGVTYEGILMLRNVGPAPGFRRGEVNEDGTVDVSDAIRIVTCLFSSTSALHCTGCEDAQDVNDDGDIDVSDAVKLLLWLFRDSPAPAAPFADCGHDRTPDDLACPHGAPSCQL